MLKTTLCGVEFENPFVLAAAPSTDEMDILRRGFERGWSGAVLKTTSVVGTTVNLKYPMISTLKDTRGRPVTTGNIDLISKYHVDEVAKRVETLKREFPKKRVIPSIMGASKEEWQSLVKILIQAGADMLECSYSCPQGTLGSKRPGAMLGQEPNLVKEVTGWVRQAAGDFPFLVKITPMVADIVEIAHAALEGGASGITASNTYPSLMGIDLDSFTPIPDVGGMSTYSGLSGSAIKPISLRLIAEIVRHTKAEVSGVGGIMNWHDGAEFLAVGARNLQICTAVMIHGFRIIDKLRSGLSRFLEQKEMSSVQEIIGKAIPRIVSHDELPSQTNVKAYINQKLCIRCNKCYISCHDGGHMAITRSPSGKVNVEEEKCVGCGLCRCVCPVTDCISMRTVK